VRFRPQAFALDIRSTTTPRLTSLVAVCASATSCSDERGHTLPFSIRDRRSPPAELVSLLGGAGIAYMVVGSFASTYHGPPRTTHDIDAVVELNETSLAQLLGAIDRDHFYIADDVSRSDRQVTDAAAVPAVAQGSLDDEYMERWARDLGIGDLLARARRLAEG
jgi:hypothetical protein